MKYQDFIKSKLAHSFGSQKIQISEEALNANLFDYQKAVVAWAIRKQRAAIFAGTGLGKSFMQIEYARHASRLSGGRILMLAPLAVAKQTIAEAKKIHVEITQGDSAIQIINYEKLHTINPQDFSGIVCDESSILKSIDGKIRTKLIEDFGKHEWKLCATATPAPNDWTEIGNHSEFLGSMTRLEMLAMFFVHDGGETQKWRLKGHARQDFFRWMATWCMMFESPYDIGFDGSRFVLPKKEEHEIIIETNRPAEGMLFQIPAAGLTEMRAERKSSVDDRVKIVAGLCNDSKEQWIVWCEMNNESSALVGAIPDSKEIRGDMSPEMKEKLIEEFLSKKIRVVVSKASIMGYGLNVQQCRKMAFVGLSYSWEQFYQAIRRIWRFGQKKSVDIYIVSTSGMIGTLLDIRRKGAEAEKMKQGIIEEMRAGMVEEIMGKQSNKAYDSTMQSGEGWNLIHGDCVEEIRRVADESIGMTVFSPPFSQLYVYSDSERDMGNCKNDGEFLMHFRYLVRELYRVMMAGRIVAVHCMDLPLFKGKDGNVGVKDFPGWLIRVFERCGFIFDGRITIWKDPVIAMQRTKSIRLLHKQIKKDSSMSGVSLPDYLLKFKKPGENPNRIDHTAEEFPVSQWQKFASPVWMDIDPGDTLQYRTARENNDERHIAPLQLGVIERALILWSKPGDLVLSPFAGIGSEGYQALKMRRRFVGIELKKSYYDMAVKNMALGVSESAGELFAAGVAE